MGICYSAEDFTIYKGETIEYYDFNNSKNYNNKSHRCHIIEIIDYNIIIVLLYYSNQKTKMKIKLLDVNIDDKILDTTKILAYLNKVVLYSIVYLKIIKLTDNQEVEGILYYNKPSKELATKSTTNSIRNLTINATINDIIKEYREDGIIKGFNYAITLCKKV